VYEPGSSRQRLAGILHEAFLEGLLSDRTLSHRLAQLSDAPLVDPRRVVADLDLRRARVEALAGPLASELPVGPAARKAQVPSAVLLALDWAGFDDDALVIGRAPACDIVLGHATVSRCHARVVTSEGHWTIQDLSSKNGTAVNGRRVAHCELRPGDRVWIGGQRVLVD